MSKKGSDARSFFSLAEAFIFPSPSLNVVDSSRLHNKRSKDNIVLSLSSHLQSNSSLVPSARPSNALLVVGNDMSFLDAPTKDLLLAFGNFL